MGTAIIPHGNPTPILDPPEHDLDCVALFVEGFVVATPCRSVFPWRNAGCDALLPEGGDQVVGIGKTGQQAFRAAVITGVPCGQQQVHRLAHIVAHRMELRIQAPFRAANTARACPFLSRLAAVRWAFR